MFCVWLWYIVKKEDIDVEFQTHVKVQRYKKSSTIVQGDRDSRDQACRVIVTVASTVP